MIPFSPPYIDDDIIESVNKALRSGWITTGPVTKLFENEISMYCMVEKVLAVNSWTSGAELLLKWWDIQAGDEVIVPAYTYCATANIIIHCGAKPVFVDITDDYLINISSIKNAITEKTKAIISVDIGGFPVKYDEIKGMLSSAEVVELFQPRTEKQKALGRVLFLSDAAHSFGARYKGVPVGSQADFTIFSFHAVKNLTTAEGGAICINLPSPNFYENEIYKELNIWSLHGQTKDALEKTRIGSWEYDVITAGYKINMTDVLASIGLVELRRYDQNLIRRRQIFELYIKILKEYNWVVLPQHMDEVRESSYHLFMIRIKGIDLAQRNEMIDRIFQSGVSVNVHYKPVPKLTFYEKLGYSLKDYPKSQEIWTEEISLPVHMLLSDENVKTVTTVLVESYKQVLNK